MIREKHINSLDDLKEIIFDQKYDQFIKRNRSSYLYRGLPNEMFHLKTSLQRNCKGQSSNLESSILRNFTKYAAIDDPLLKESIWRQLIIGQHHGLPTRLLDWTYSPLIGLHFATSGEDFSEMKNHNAVLWRIDILEINNILPERYKNELKKEYAYLFTIDMLERLVKDLQGYDQDMMNQSMVLIEPPSIDQRIINQYSYFSIIPKKIEDIEEFFEKHTSVLTC